MTPARSHERAWLTFAAVAAFGVLAVALWLNPDPRGFGTHEQLGLLPCGFKRLTGIPCLACGMTTAFSWTVRGEFARAWSIQPFGTFLALMTPAIGLLCAGFAVANRSLVGWLGPRLTLGLVLAGSAGLLAAWGAKVWSEWGLSSRL